MTNPHGPIVGLMLILVVLTSFASGICFYLMANCQQEKLKGDLILSITLFVLSCLVAFSVYRIVYGG